MLTCFASLLLTFWQAVNKNTQVLKNLSYYMQTETCFKSMTTWIYKMIKKIARLVLKVLKCRVFEWLNKRDDEPKCCPIKFEYQIGAQWYFSIYCLLLFDGFWVDSCIELILKVNQNISFTCSWRIKRKKLVISIYSWQTSFNIIFEYIDVWWLTNELLLLGL